MGRPTLRNTLSLLASLRGGADTKTLFRFLNQASLIIKRCNETVSVHQNQNQNQLQETLTKGAPSVFCDPATPTMKVSFSALLLLTRSSVAGFRPRPPRRVFPSPSLHLSALRGQMEKVHVGRIFPFIGRPLLLGAAAYNSGRQSCLSDDVRRS